MDETKRGKNENGGLNRKLGDCIKENFKKLRKNQPFSNRTKSQRLRQKHNTTRPDPPIKITKNNYHHHLNNFENSGPFIQSFIFSCV